MSASNRYLLSFDSRTALHRFTDVLVIGAGIAGLRAALEISSTTGVHVVTKDRITESNSSYAQGGIASVLSPFIFDTVFTFGKRLLRGERVYEAHRSHLYQQMAA